MTPDDDLVEALASAVIRRIGSAQVVKLTQHDRPEATVLNDSRLEAACRGAVDGAVGTVTRLLRFYAGHFEKGDAMPLCGFPVRVVGQQHGVQRLLDLDGMPHTCSWGPTFSRPCCALCREVLTDDTQYWHEGLPVHYLCWEQKHEQGHDFED